MSIDVMDKLFGDTEGHEINVEIDSVGEALLSKLGLPTTKAGAIVLLENVLDAGINAIPGLSAEEKTAAEAVLNSVLSNAANFTSGSTVPAATAKAVIKTPNTPPPPSNTENQEGPILDEPVFKNL